MASRSAFLLAIGLACVPAGAAGAADLCSNVKALVTEARANFPDWATGARFAQCRQLYPLVCPGASSAWQTPRRKNEELLYQLAMDLN